MSRGEIVHLDGVGAGRNPRHAPAVGVEDADLLARPRGEDEVGDLRGWRRARGRWRPWRRRRPRRRRGWWSDQRMICEHFAAEVGILVGQPFVVGRLDSGSNLEWNVPALDAGEGRIAYRLVVVGSVPAQVSDAGSTGRGSRLRQLPIRSRCAPRCARTRKAPLARQGTRPRVPSSTAARAGS
jgi:hypothetical protein